MGSGGHGCAVWVSSALTAPSPSTGISFALLWVQLASPSSSVGVVHLILLYVGPIGKRTPPPPPPAQPVCIEQHYSAASSILIVPVPPFLLGRVAPRPSDIGWNRWRGSTFGSV